MPPKGWKSGREETQVKAVRLSASILERIGRYVEYLQVELPDVPVNEGLALRRLIRIGLDTVEGQIPQPQPTPPIQAQPPLALEPAPATEVQPARKSQTSSSRRKDGKGGNPGIPDDKLQQIADERTPCEGLSLGDFAQRLFEKGIYRSKAENGSEIPVNRGTITKWLKRARDQGML